MTLPNMTPTDEGVIDSPKRLSRTAVVVRVWHKFRWTQETIIHMRAVIAELSLLSSGEYQVIFLVHVKKDPRRIWASADVYSQLLREALPAEFVGMGILWSRPQMSLIYEGLPESRFMGRPVHGVYRSAHFPLQLLAYNHPEYEYFWNWEIDIRYTGHWYALFESLRSFARQQPRKGLWERNERFHIPSVHGTWENFTQLAREQAATPPPPDPEMEPMAEPSVWGPKAPNDTPAFPDDPMPPRGDAADNDKWGVGEEADLITLNPLFNPEHTGWVFADDTTGYNVTKHSRPPRRTSIITASRLSRRLLTAMHVETSVYNHTMFDEMWPATVALHHGFKAVYAPHPVFVDRAWPPSYLAERFNGGLNGASGTAWTSPFNVINEHNFKGITWYFNAGFPSNLWRRWLGFRVDGAGGNEDETQGEGRMCLPPMLLHPVKEFEFEIEEPDLNPTNRCVLVKGALHFTSIVLERL